MSTTTGGNFIYRILWHKVIIAGKNELTRVITSVNEMKTKQVIHSKPCKTVNNLRQMFLCVCYVV